LEDKAEFKSFDMTSVNLEQICL